MNHWHITVGPFRSPKAIVIREHLGTRPFITHSVLDWNAVPDALALNPHVTVHKLPRHHVAGISIEYITIASDDGLPPQTRILLNLQQLPVKRRRPRATTNNARVATLSEADPPAEVDPIEEYCLLPDCPGSPLCNPETHEAHCPNGVVECIPRNLNQPISLPEGQRENLGQ